MLFTNPRQWTKGAVGSWWRFGFLTAVLGAISVYSVYVAAESGFRSGLVIALMPMMYQVMFLYALRRMYLQATGVEGVKSAA